MFSQRNNPYCELLQNCIAMIQQKFYYSNTILSKKMTIFLLNLIINLKEGKFKKIHIKNEENIRIGFGDNINWLVFY
jgi:hypothetical protein